MCSEKASKPQLDFVSTTDVNNWILSVLLLPTQREKKKKLNIKSWQNLFSILKLKVGIFLKKWNNKNKCTQNMQNKWKHIQIHIISLIVSYS